MDACSLEGLTISDAGMQDIPSLIELMRWLEANRPQFTGVDIRRREWALKRLMSQPERARIMVARDAENVCVGMCQLTFFISVLDGGLVAWIETLSVVPAVRGKGVGQALLEAAEAFCMAHGIVRLAAHASEPNVAVTGRMMQRAGFVGEPCLLLQKSVAPALRKLS